MPRDTGFAQDCSLALDITPSRLGCSAWFVACLLWVCLLHAGVRWGWLSAVTSCTLAHWPPTFSFEHGDGRPAPFIFSSFPLCVCIGGWARVWSVFELAMRDELFKSCLREKNTEYYSYFGKRFWKPTCSRRTVLSSLRKFKEFGTIVWKRNNARAAKFSITHSMFSSGPCTSESLLSYWRNLFSL